MLSTRISPWALHPSIIMSRIIVLTLKLILIFAGMYLVVIINNIPLSQISIAGLAGHFAAALLLMGFFLIIGAIIGQIIESTWKGVASIVVFWLVLMFFIPGTINALVNRDAKKITSQYNTELEKLNISFDFEKRAVEKYGKFDRKNIETARMIIEDFWNNDYRKIIALEEKQKKEIARVIDKYNKISLVTPVTFYDLTAPSLSTRGYNTFLDFYNYVKDLQVKFVRFIIDRTYYNDPKVMVSFIKENENLFQGTNKLPPDFGKGLLINLGIIIALYLLSFFLFKDSLYKIREDDIKKLGDEVDLKMDKGNLYAWLARDNKFSNLIFNLFSGRYDKVKEKGFTGKVLINGVDIASEKSKEDFIYICRPDDLPGDLKVKDFFYFYAAMMKIPKEEIRTILGKNEIKTISDKTFEMLTATRKFDVLLNILNTGNKPVYIIDDISAGLHIDNAIMLKEKMDKLAERGSLVIYLTTESRTDLDLSRTDLYFSNGNSWVFKVEAKRSKKRTEESK